MTKVSFASRCSEKFKARVQAFDEGLEKIVSGKRQREIPFTA
jgi:hypothetical protein